MSRLKREVAAEPVSRDQMLRRERGQRKKKIPRSADHEQDWLISYILQGLALVPRTVFILGVSKVNGHTGIIHVMFFFSWAFCDFARV